MVITLSDIEAFILSSSFNDLHVHDEVAILSRKTEDFV